MNSSAQQKHSLLTESWIFAGRLFIQWRRYPMVPLQALLFPTMLLVIYGILVGKSMVRLTGNSGLDVLIPVCTLAGAMSGSIGAGLAVPHDRDSGLLTRLWIMPVHRLSPLTGALLAEAVRTFIASALVVAMGYAMGFRFSGSAAALLGYLLIPVVVVVVFATIVISLALKTTGPGHPDVDQHRVHGPGVRTAHPARQDSGAVPAPRRVPADRAGRGGHAGAVVGDRTLAADSVDARLERGARRPVRADHRPQVPRRGRKRQHRRLSPPGQA